MIKNCRKLVDDKSGFTLTEVMIGIMILTIAVVTATNLLIGLINSNKNNVKTLQAYYEAQEGIELVRNIRDTNWLHNVDWLGDEFGVGKEYFVELRDRDLVAFYHEGDEIDDRRDMKKFAPWEVGTYSAPVEITEDFDRVISIKGCEDVVKECVVVQSKVMWSDVGKEREVVLEEVLTDWKGGAL